MQFSENLTAEYKSMCCYAVVIRCLANCILFVLTPWPTRKLYDGPQVEKRCIR